MNNTSYEQEICINAISSAYKKGYEDGTKEKPESFYEAYKHGLNHAWDCARDIGTSVANGGIDYFTLKEIFGTGQIDEIFANYTVQEAMAKMKEYKWGKTEKSCKTCKWSENKSVLPHNICNNHSNWTPKQTDDGIKVGDEVETENESLEVWDRIISDIKCLKGVWSDYSENPLFEAAIMSLNDALNIIKKHLSTVEIDTESEK